MVAPSFDYFVVFAEMRTGSNFLEDNINQFADLSCHGELFNPHFVGYPNKSPTFSTTQSERDANPVKLLQEVIATSTTGMSGFRLFSDHDPRITKYCLEDRRCAKIILTRNPLDSYISRKIAAKTGQWKLTDMKNKRSAQVEFDGPEFGEYLEQAQSHQGYLQRELQVSGQTAFYINYDDIGSLDVLNGLAGFLGSTHQVEKVSKSLKKQNPSSLEDKVINYNEMIDILKEIDYLGMSKTPNFEPRRGAGVPGYIACEGTALLFLPVRGVPTNRVVGWMNAHNSQSELLSGFNQKTLRQWMRHHVGQQCFTVVCHPIRRIHRVFATRIWPNEGAVYSEIRNVLRRKYDISLPVDGAGEKDADQFKIAFQDFLLFLKGNLAAQTSVRIDPAWATQTTILQGASKVALPHHIIRESQLQTSLVHIENLLGLDNVAVPEQEPTAGIQLSEIYDEKIEALVRDVYQRDYLSFGFSSWADENPS